jgi:hypothetical protein
VSTTLGLPLHKKRKNSNKQKYGSSKSFQNFSKVILTLSLEHYPMAKKTQNSISVRFGTIKDDFVDRVNAFNEPDPNRSYQISPGY